jgi:hypothetical protein
MTPWDALSAQIDWPELVRGASTGFTLLIVGFYTGPMMANVPLIGEPWLLVVAVAAFAAAGWRIGDAVSPPMHGALAALTAYVLFVPIVFLGLGRVPLDQWQLVMTPFAIAIVVGAAVGAYRRRQRGW